MKALLKLVAASLTSGVAVAIGEFDAFYCQQTASRLFDRSSI
jgi:hypothetical protein